MMSKYLFSFIFFTCVTGILCQVYKASSGSQSNGNKNNNVVDVIETLPEPEAIKNDLITQTVYGFLDFTTTIGNTVMVFSPQSAPPEGEKKQITSAIQTKPSSIVKKNTEIQPSKTHKGDENSLLESKKSIKNTKVVVNSVVQAQKDVQPAKIEATKSAVLLSVVQVTAKEATAVKNNLAEPEYEYLSKQPAEIIDETYKVINLSPTTKSAQKPRPTQKKENPTGLVTKLGGTVIKDGLTTVHETSVIGTYINGKYAQVLQSTSRIVKPGNAQGNLDNNNNFKIRPTNTQKILKTIGPQHGKLKPTQLEPTPTQQEESSLPLEVLFSAPAGNNVKVTRRPSVNNAIRPKFRNKISDDQESSENSQPPRNFEKNRHTTSRPNFKNRPITTTTTSEPPTTRRRTGFRPTNTSPKVIRPKSEQGSSNPIGIPKVKLPRTQGRWSYKTTPKPRIAIRKQAIDDEEKVVSTPETVMTSEVAAVVAAAPSAAITSTAEEKSLVPPSAQRKIISVSEGVAAPAPVDEELDSSESELVNTTSDQGDQVDAILPAETLNVEISTASDLNDVYYEIATIKTPYTFQVGTMKNTRFITVTSTLKKSFATADASTPSSTQTEPLTENILANTGAAYESSLPLDSSIATLPAITLESGQMTPPLETLTETFTTTQTLLKTYLLPVVAGGNTTKHTLVQTYNIARMVTATKTLPPSEIYQFIPSKTLNEFNSKLDEAGSELHLELDFGEDENDDDDIPKRILVPSDNSDLESFKASSKQSGGKVPDVSTPVTSTEPQLTPEQIALLKYFNQGVPGAHVVTSSRPIVVLETLYESHVIPLVNNGNTIFSTLSRPVGTVPRTSYELRTSTLPSPPLVPPPVPPVPIFPPHAPQFTVTSAPIITQTLATLSDSRVLKLTFGAKTAYTTLFSTRVVPTEITTYVTTTIPVQPTVPSYPGYFGAPVGYPAFPYVG